MNGKDREEQDRIEPLVGRARDQQRRQQRDEDDAGQDDAPALVHRIAAEHELRELRPHEGPAGARPALRQRAALVDRQAGGPVRAGPLRVEDRPAEYLRQRPGDEQQREDGQHGIDRRREEILADPGAYPGLASEARPRASAISVRTQDMSCSSMGHLSFSAILALNQFMNSEVSRLMLR